MTPEFRLLLDKQPPHIRARVAEMTALLGKAHPVLKDVRNDVGGHVAETAVKDALERLEPGEAFGYWDIGPTAGESHYKFVSEIMDEMLLKDVSAEDRKKIESSKFELMAESLQAVQVVEVAFLMYAIDRRLLKISL